MPFCLKPGAALRVALSINLGVAPVCIQSGHAIVGAPSERSAGLAHFSHRELPIRGESVAIDGPEPLLPHVLLGHK